MRWIALFGLLCLSTFSFAEYVTFTTPEIAREYCPNEHELLFEPIFPKFDKSPGTIVGYKSLKRFASHNSMVHPYRIIPSPMGIVIDAEFDKVGGGMDTHRMVEFDAIIYTLRLSAQSLQCK